MCERTSVQRGLANVALDFHATVAESATLPKRYNIAPRDPLPVIQRIKRVLSDRKHTVQLFKGSDILW